MNLRDCRQNLNGRTNLRQECISVDFERKKKGGSLELDQICFMVITTVEGLAVTERDTDSLYDANFCTLRGRIITHAWKNGYDKSNNKCCFAVGT